MSILYDVPAPAKLNLFLHITGRRPDGYHLLQSVFMLIDWQDRLHFERRPNGQITREDLSVQLPVDDLCLRAAHALQAATGCSHGVHIGIDKQIPAEAGMGGGSSDAASCLLALNRLWQLQLTLRQLEEIGLSLGADVPFFLRGRNAWVEGIGEHITPLTLPSARFVVVKPEAGLSTAAIFSHPDLQRATNRAIVSDFAADVFGFGRNDLQPVAQQLCPPIHEVIETLNQAGLSARMTGSGSAVFARTEKDVLSSLSHKGLQTRVCSNLEVHPLHGWASG